MSKSRSKAATVLDLKHLRKQRRRRGRTAAVTPAYPPVDLKMDAVVAKMVQALSGAKKSVFPARQSTATPPANLPLTYREIKWTGYIVESNKKTIKVKITGEDGTLDKIISFSPSELSEAERAKAKPDRIIHYTFLFAEHDGKGVIKPGSQRYSLVKLPAVTA